MGEIFVRNYSNDTYNHCKAKIKISQNRKWQWRGRTLQQICKLFRQSLFRCTGQCLHTTTFSFYCIRRRERSSTWKPRDRRSASFNNVTNKRSFLAKSDRLCILISGLSCSPFYNSILPFYFCLLKLIFAFLILLFEIEFCFYIFAVWNWSLHFTFCFLKLNFAFLFLFYLKWKFVFKPGPCGPYNENKVW